MLKSRPDILDYLDFHFYDIIKYYESDTYPSNTGNFVKWLGPSKYVGSDLCYKILK